MAVQPWRSIQINISGGISGHRIRETITSDGRVTVNNLKTNTETTYELTSEALAQISAYANFLLTTSPIHPPQRSRLANKIYINTYINLINSTEEDRIPATDSKVHISDSDDEQSGIIYNYLASLGIDPLNS